MEKHLFPHDSFPDNPDIVIFLLKYLFRIPPRSAKTLTNVCTALKEKFLKSYQRLFLDLLAAYELPEK